MSNEQNDKMFPDAIDNSQKTQEQFTSAAFSGELDAADLAFLSDQQSEIIVGGDGYCMNNPLPPGLDGLPPGLTQRPPGWDRGKAPWKNP